MTLFAVADALGLISFSISGYLMGVRKGLDILGLLVAAFMTALGGGIVRDAIVGRTPVAFTDSFVLICVTIGVILALSFGIHKKRRPERYSIFILADSIGLVAFAITGAMVAVESHFNIFGVMLLAFITAVGGGMLRDMMVNEVPMVLTSDFYGTIALLIGAAVYLCDRAGCMGNATLAVIFAAALTLRLVAYKKGWQLPKIGGRE
ncbi:MAG: TRIC cation channel family protein [Hydrogenimonas sp.]|nr:TRIC cation channel family protein [Hydrogenimonas sp.]